MATSAKSKPQKPSVAITLVTGDIVIDHHIYIGEQRTATATDADKRETYEYVELGGAAMIERLLRLPSDVQDPAWMVHFGLVEDHKYYPHCFATWKPYPEPDPKKKRPSFWLAREAGYGIKGSVCRERKENSAETTGCPAKAPDLSEGVKVLVVDDAGSGFRDRPECWPSCLTDPAKAPEWLVWKMAGNLRGGKLWNHVKKVPDISSRLILVVSSADLRRAGMDVTVGLSWERSALDIAKALKNTTLEPLKAATQVIVSLPGPGALWVNRKEPDEYDPDAPEKTVVRLIYDPSGGEGVQIAPNRPKVFGYQACLTAGVVWSVASAQAGQALNLSNGVIRGVVARNKLYTEGHGELDPTRSPEGFPAEVIQREALIPDPNPERKPRFAITVIPDWAPKNWTIAQQGMMAPGPFYDIACAVARDGLDALPSVPWLKMGGYTTIERAEIEAIRRLRRRVQNYISQERQKRPLSIAVFGAPGSGKSFIVEQMAKGLLGKDIPFIESNLSQFSDEKDLQGAFHLVRDEVLKGKTPVVFWDEFDSQEYRWLRLLLAPMQDGKFREGQVIHPIGKCIFIFAGGTSDTFENFGNPDKGTDAVDARRQERSWRMAKGPDFKSRIHGHLDVLGPNPRLVKRTGSRVTFDKSDACFPIRRALFLRGVWRLDPKKKGPEVDEKLVRGLFEVPMYTNGSRSFERVLSDLARGKDRIGPEALPAPEDLDRDISSPEDSRRLVNTAHGHNLGRTLEGELGSEIERRVDEFAARINQVYMKNPAEVRNADVTFAYDNLSLFLKESNRAAVRRIPIILQTAGLVVVKHDAPGALSLEEALKHLEGRIEDAASAEHKAWCEFHEERGWEPTDSQSDPKDPLSDPPRHPLLVPWEMLEKKSDKEKDRVQVRHYVEIVYDIYGKEKKDEHVDKVKFALAPIEP